MKSIYEVNSMQKLSEKYEDNVSYFEKTLRVSESFDVLCKKLSIGDGELTFFFIDGFLKILFCKSL